MKKRLISSTIILAIALQLLSFPAFSFSNESDYPQVFQNAMCNDKNFIALIDEATENDDYINDSAISIEANSSDVKSNGTKETLSNAVIMHDEELYVPVKAMSDILDYEVNLNSESGEAYIQCEDESIIISTNPDDSDEEDLQGVLIDGITYAPVSDVASISGYQITLSEDGNKARLTDKFITRRLFIKIKNTDAFTDSAFAEIFLNTAKLAINSDRLIFAVYNTADEAERAYEILKGHPYVEYVESDGLLQVGFNSSYSWGTEYCNADYFSLNNPVIQNSEEIITVAVIDSGLNAQDPVFEGRVTYDSSATTVKDTHGHGTHVAGIVASFTQSAADNVKICPYKLEVDDDGSISYTSVANLYSVIQKASAHDIINMSLSISPLSEYQTLQTAITNSRNSLFVVAAGNDSTAVNSDSLANFVQSKANGIGVTAIGKSGEPASFTNHAISPSDHYIAAPGLNIRSTYYLHGYDYMNMSGTSQAAPHVAGACALLFLSTEKQDTPTEIKNTLFDSYCVAPEGWNTYYGRGQLHFDYKTSGEYENFEWSFEDRTLTITGSGMLPEVTDTSSLPWIFHNNFIDKVCFNGDIDGISRESIGNLPSVESLEVSDDNTHYKSVSGALFSKDTSTLLYCPGIESGSEFIIPDGTISISAGAFSSCKNLISVVIPASVTTIEENAFSDCVDLAHIYYIGTEAQWKAMQRLDGWDKNAGTEAYENKYSLLCSYNAPDIVGVCGDTAVWKFWYIGGVLRIEGKGEIYDYDYVYDEENPGVIIGNTAGWSEYKDNILNFEIDNGITVIGARAFNSCGKFTDVVLPDTVTTIKEQAFDKTLKTLTLSKNFSHFDISAFTYSSGLENIYVHEENTAFSSKDGILYNKDGSELYFYPNGIMNESFTIPDGVRIIKDDAFSKNYVLKYISFNDCLEEIGDRAFKGTTMYALTALPSSLKRIGYRAFENCDNITIVSLPEGLEAIGERAFFSCDRLKEVHLPSSIKEIGGFAFSSSNYINKITFNGTQELWNTIQFADDWNNGIEDVTLTFNSTPTVSGSFGNNFTWTLDYSTGKLSINGKGAMDGYENYNEPWHDYIDSITSVELSEGITSIKGYTFYNHQRIKSVSLPQSLEIIDDYTFYNCSALESIIIPDNVKSIDDYAFYKCTNLSTVVFPESLETIGSAAFNYSAVEKAALPNGVTSIGAYAFNNCSDLTEIHFSEALQTIGNYAFSGCSKVTEITLPSTLTTIGNYAFSGCSISEIVIPDKVIGIPEYAFANCKNLTSVTVPKSVKTIGNRAFYSDYYLSDIYYKGPSSGWNAISKHSSWSEYAGIYTSNRKPTIHYGEENHYSGTFGDNLTWVYWIDRKVLEISGNGAMPTWSTAEDVPWVGYISYISSVNISDGITGIGDYAFYNATALCEIVIPESVLSIGSNAFYGCTALTKITIPDNVTSIGSSAFYGCTMLDSIALSKKLTVIGDNAFYGCTALTKITIPDNVTSIGSSAFYGCTMLDSIALSKKLTVIGDNAFYGCSVLNDISLPDTLSDIGQGAFRGCLSLEEITIPQKVNTLKAYTFYNCSKLVKVNFSGNITEIGNYAFYNCTVLESITLPDSITTIGNSAFNNCSSLKTIKLPEKVTTIDSYAFYGCSALEAIELPDSLLTIGTELFRGCTSLKDFTSGTSLTEIPMRTFYNCTSLISVKLGSSLKSISEYAFYNCSQLQSIVIPESVEAIKSSAFFGCYLLGDIYYEGNNVGWKLLTKANGWDYNLGCNTETGTYEVHFIKGYETKGTCGENLTWEFFPESGLLKITGTGSMTAWKSANTVMWYDFRRDIKKVHLEEGITNISDYSFTDYPLLSVVEFPKSLSSIGSAFSDCTNLSDIYYAGSSYNWGTITKGQNWDKNAGTATEAGKYTVHYGEENIYTGNFGDNLTWKYYETQEILEISGKGAMPDYTSVYQTPWYYKSSNAKKIVISDGVTSIGSNSFKNHVYVTDVIIPKGCLSIGNSAFQYCSALTTFSVPEGCTAIGNNAFQNCSSLFFLTLPDSITSIGSSAIIRTGYLTDIYYAGTEKMWESITKASDWYGSGTWSKPPTVHFNDEEVPDPYSGVCGENTKWNFDTDTNTLTISGTGAIDNWTSTTNVPWNVFTTDIEHVEISNGVTSIGAFAFKDCKKLVDVNISGKIESIGDESFRNCWYLTNINIPDSVSHIGKYAFSGCSRLTELKLPNGLTTISESTFSGCMALTSIVLPEDLTSIDSSAFRGCTSLAEIALPESLKSIDFSAFRECTALKSVKLPENLDTLGEYAFYNCTGLTDITMPKKLTILDNQVFRYCSALKTITIHEGVTSIGNYVFENCSALESIYLPKSLKSIGANAFSITGLKDVFYAGSENSWKDVLNYYDIRATVHYGEENSYFGTCGENLTWTYWEQRQLLEIIGTGTMTDWTSYTKTPWYKYISKIKKIEIDEGVESIGNYAFGGCTILNEINIPESVSAIGNYAFLSCNALSTVNYNGSDINWDKMSKGFGNTTLTNSQIIYCKNCVSLTPESISVTIDDGTSAHLAVACYDGKELIDICFITVTESVSLPIGSDGIILKTSSGNTVKAYLWSNDNSLTALCKKVSVIVP